MNITELRECVAMLEEMAPLSTRKVRIAEVDRLTNEYVESTGRVPEPALLERMANVILHEELTDKDKDKMSKVITDDMTEDEKRMYSYPILSDNQYARRTEGRHKGNSRRKDNLTYREVPLEHARNRATDGKDYTTPTRKYV